MQGHTASIVLLHIDAALAKHMQECVYTHTCTNGVCKLPATEHKKGVAEREQLINPAVLGPDG